MKFFRVRGHCFRLVRVARGNVYRVTDHPLPNFCVYCRVNYDFFVRHPHTCPIKGGVL